MRFSRPTHVPAASTARARQADSPRGAAPALAGRSCRAWPRADLGGDRPLARRGGRARHRRAAARRRGEGALRQPAVDHLRRAGPRRRGGGGRRQGACRRRLAAIRGGERQRGEDRRRAGDELQEGTAGAQRAGHQVRPRHDRQRQLHRQAAGQRPAVSARRDRHRLRSQPAAADLRVEPVDRRDARLLQGPARGHGLGGGAGGTQPQH